MEVERRAGESAPTRYRPRRPSQSVLLVGWLGGLLERVTGTQFWLLHAALVAAATACMGAAAWLFRRRFGVAFEGAREADSTSIARP